MKSIELVLIINELVPILSNYFLFFRISSHSSELVHTLRLFSFLCLGLFGFLVILPMLFRERSEAVINKPCMKRINLKNEKNVGLQVK